MTKPTKENVKEGGYISFKLSLNGDEAYFSIPAPLSRRFRDYAKSLDVYPADLLRWGIEQYGFSADVFEQVLSTQEEDDGKVRQEENG